MAGISFFYFWAVLLFVCSSFGGGLGIDIEHGMAKVAGLLNCSGVER
jgi:hypothetical protein